MKLTFLFLLLFALGSSHAQVTFRVDSFSADYYGIVEIKDTSETFSPGTITIYQSKTNKALIRLKSDELAASLQNGHVLANKLSLPYGEQSMIIYDDFNFDGKKDFAVEDGQNSCYHGPSFRIYLASAKDFVFDSAFTRLAQEYCGMFQYNVDTKTINTMTKSGCCWHEFSEFIIANSKPKAISIITSDQSNFPFEKYTEEKWNGKNMDTKSVKTINIDQDGITVILSFSIPESNKKLILYNINDRTLNYVLLKKDSTVEFSYPIETVYQNPDFIFHDSPSTPSVTFVNGNATYKVYETTDGMGVQVKLNGKVYDLKGDIKNKKGSLTTLGKVKLDNVVYH